MIAVPAVKLLDKSLNLLSVIEGYSSLRFVRRWQTVGEFELHFNFNTFGAENIKNTEYIMLDNDGHRVGIVDDFEANENQNGLEVTIIGRTLSGFASQRITVPPEGSAYDLVPLDTMVGTYVSAETVLKEYARRHMTGTENRAVDFLTVAPDLNRGIRINWMSRYKQLDETLKAVGEYADIGWEIYFDVEEKRFVFDVVPGVDRSASQMENSYVIFSRDFENISSLSFKKTRTGFKNLGYAGGEGEGVNRSVLQVYSAPVIPTGTGRHEIFLDCGNVLSTDTAESFGLEWDGRKRLKEYERPETLSASVITNTSFVYQKDWNIGDKVTVVSNTMGLQQDKRISEITENYEAGTLSIDLVFGLLPVRFNNIIKRTRNNVVL